jgi:hypothetical protein
MLVPMGFINEIHEPPFFHGALRPEVERRIIPTTWRELGIGIFGEPVAGLSYKLYAIAGMNAERFSRSGWRDGRQSGAQFLSEQWGVVGRLDYKYGDLVQVGGAAYYGGADQGKVAARANTFLAEGHLQARYHGLELRGLAAYGTLSGARELTLALFPTDTTQLIASALYGWYLEAAYDLWPLFSKRNLYLAPYFRYERYNTQYETPEISGRAPNLALDVSIVEAGLTFKPHPQIVVKLTYRDTSNAADALVADQFLVGAGFIY